MPRSLAICIKNAADQVNDLIGHYDYGYLNQWSLEKSLRLACVCGALSTQRAGGTDAQPTFNEAIKYLAR